MIRVLVLTDIRLYREGLASLLGRQDEMEVVGTGAVHGANVPDLLATEPDVLLLDTATLDDLAALRSLVSAFDGVKVIALAVPETEGDVVACAEGGVAGYVPRDGDITALLRAIDSAGRGELRCTPRLAGALARRVAALASERANGNVAGPAAELTGREREVLGLIDEGLSNKQIAARLCIEVATVKNHVHNILEKLHVHRRSEAAARIRSHREVAAQRR